MDNVPTSSSLIERLKLRNDEQAWEEFCTIYQPFLLGWVKRTGVPANDADDIVQTTLLSVYNAIPGLEYERGYRGGFRGYLRTAVHSKVADYWRKARRSPPHLRLLDEIDAVQADQQAVIWDHEYMHYFLEQCLQEVRPHIADDTWEIFTSYVLKQVSAEELAQWHGTTLQAIYSRVHRVVDKLREHIGRIDPDLWPDL